MDCIFHIRSATSDATCCTLDTRWLHGHVLLMSFSCRGLGKTRPLEVLNRCYKAVIKSLEYAFCLYLQMVSHAIKMSSVSKNADGKGINARFLFFNTSGLLPPSPCAFHLCQLHKRKGVSPVKQRNNFFSSPHCCMLSFPSLCFTTTCPRVK